jgi:hypothetical protein
MQYVPNNVQLCQFIRTGQCSLDQNIQLTLCQYDLLLRNVIDHCERIVSFDQAYMNLID